MPAFTVDKEARVNGAVAMPVETIDVALDDLGYTGWVAKMRTNPRSRDYDNLYSQDFAIEWKGLQAIVLSWNFKDEDGKNLPQPKDLTDAGDLPWKVRNELITRYFNFFRKENGIPKESESNSGNTSTVNEQGAT